MSALPNYSYSQRRAADGASSVGPHGALGRLGFVLLRREDLADVLKNSAATRLQLPDGQEKDLKAVLGRPEADVVLEVAAVEAGKTTALGLSRPASTRSSAIYTNCSECPPVQQTAA